MKSLQRTLLLLLLTVVSLAGLAQAQYADRIISVKIPFEFKVGKKTLPAGDYLVIRTSPYFLVLRNSQGRVLTTTVAATAQSSTLPSQSKLVFYVQGGEHSLLRVWQAGDRWGNELTLPKHNTAEARVQGAQVEVAGR